MPYQSLYTALEYRRLIPLWGQETGNKFKKANEGWMAEYLAEPGKLPLPSRKEVQSSAALNAIKVIAERFLSGRPGDLLESFLGLWQSRHIKRSSRKNTMAGKGRVVMSAARLEFHPRSREAPLLDAYNQRMKSRRLAAFGGQRDSGLSSPKQLG